MKNVRGTQLKKAIFMLSAEFFELARELELELDEKEYVGNNFWYGRADEIVDAFSRYYDVTITSIHADNFDEVGVWMVYED